MCDVIILGNQLLCNVYTTFLNQAHAGCKPAHDWFLEIAFIRDVVCVSAPKDIHVNGPCMTGWTNYKSI